MRIISSLVIPVVLIVCFASSTSSQKRVRKHVQPRYARLCRQMRAKNTGFMFASLIITSECNKSIGKNHKYIKEGKLTRFMSAEFTGDIARNPSRAALKYGGNHWPNATIPYKFNSQLRGSSKSVILSAMKHIEDHTCVKFRKRTDEKNYVYVEQRSAGCFSALGMIGGLQVVNLGPECLGQIGTAVHEFLHALGFVHEHNRPDRDDFVEVGIIFDHLHTGQVVSHSSNYGARGFSANYKPTLVPKDKNADIGQRTALSKLDIEEINEVYCSEKSSVDQNGSTVDPYCFDQNGAEYCASIKIYCSTNPNPWYESFVDKGCRKTCNTC